MTFKVDTYQSYNNLMTYYAHKITIDNNNNNYNDNNPLNIETLNVVYPLKMLRVVKLVAFFIAIKLTILEIINIIAPP